MFGSDLNSVLYEMERVKDTEDELEIAFHYCPYVNKWKKQGRTPEEISHLCEVTMAGDHEYAKHFPCCRFDLEGRLPMATLSAHCGSPEIPIFISELPVYNCSVERKLQCNTETVFSKRASVQY